MTPYKQIVKVAVSLFGLVYANMTIVRFAKHLSYLPSGQVFKDRDGSIFSLFKTLSIDWLLVCAFIVQHSFLLPVIKSFFSRIGFSSIERSVYVILTSISLQALVVYWNVSTSHFIWNVDLTDKVLLWWAYALIHCFAWIQFFIQFVCVDPLDLFGIKQVYYDLNGWDDPLVFKSDNLRSLCCHMRHHCLIVLNIVLFVYPVMSIDRLLLSVMLTFYMLIVWKPTNLDYVYIKQQTERKKEQVMGSM